MQNLCKYIDRRAPYYSDSSRTPPPPTTLSILLITAPLLSEALNPKPQSVFGVSWQWGRPKLPSALRRVHGAREWVASDSGQDIGGVGSALRVQG